MDYSELSKFDQSLFDRWPYYFGRLVLTQAQSCMGRGTAIGPGWNELIEHLVLQIESHEKSITQYNEYAVKHNNSIDTDPDYIMANQGYRKLYDWSPFKFEQIKEKFGQLRIYYEGGNQYVEGLIAATESFSARVCDVCGERGEIVRSKWLACRCVHHRK